MNDEKQSQVEESTVCSKHSTHSVVDENDLELCIRNSQDSPCTSMGDKIPVGSESKSPPVLGSRAHPMTEDMEVVLLDFVKDKMLEFNFNKPIFRSEVWQAITNDFNYSFETSYGFTQLRTKLSNMRKDWRIWNRIKSQTGVGWDSENQVFTCLDWDLLEQHVKGAKNFASKRLTHFEALNELFMGSGATGKRGTTPRSIPFTHTGDDCVDLNFYDDIELGNDDNDSPTMVKRSLKRGIGEGPSTYTQRGSKASKRSTNEPITVSAGSHVSNTVHNIRMEKSTYDPTQEAVKLLEKMELDDELFIRAFKWLLESRSNAAGFLNISEQHRRIWIQSLPPN